MSDNSVHRKVYLISEKRGGLHQIQDIVQSNGLHLVHDGDTFNNETVKRVRKCQPAVIFLDSEQIDSHNENLVNDLKVAPDGISTPLYIVDLTRSSNGVNIEKEDLEHEDIEFANEKISVNEIDSLINEITDPAIHIIFWGVRGSTPCANKENIVYGGNTTCIQIDLPYTDNYLILDSGTGIRNLGNAITKQNRTVRGKIFITHPHWDHIQGFPFFKPIYTPKNHFDIHMPPQAHGGCMEILSGHLTKNFFPITLEMIDANLEFFTQSAERVSYEGYEIEYMLANHPINTAIYKIHINGKKIVFSPDNELTPETKETHPYFYSKCQEFLKDVDLLIHDAQFNRNNYDQKVGWGHSTWEDVVDFAVKANIKNVILTHHDPDSDDTYLSELDDQLERDCSTLFDTIQLAKEGAKVAIPIAE